jgi:DtxR family Mn-dependent transcriptional regulator
VGLNTPVSGDLIDTTEMYLRTVFELEEEGITPLRARIAERLGQSGPTVSQTVARMERDGLLTVAGDRHLELTEVGRTYATRVMRKHRLAECLLVDVIGIPLEQVHAEACKWEHVMSETVERRLMEILDQPRVSPFGNPIPGLSDLLPDMVDDRSDMGGWTTLAAAATAGHASVTLQRITEPVQVEGDLMVALESADVHPGSLITIAQDGAHVVVRSGAGEVQVPNEVAAHIVVSA